MAERNGRRKRFTPPKTIPTKEKFYILDMFPYPSGEGLHVGHPKGYIATDIVSRMKRMQGKTCFTQWVSTRSACRRRITP